MIRRSGAAVLHSCPGVMPEARDCPPRPVTFRGRSRTRPLRLARQSPFPAGCCKYHHLPGTTGTLVKPTAVVPANDSLTAGLCDSLGGRSWETLTTGLALNTDAMLQAYQVPAGVRLKIEGVKLTASVQTVLAGGPFVNEFHLAFGFTGTTPSLQAAVPPMRVLLPELTQLAAAAQAVGTALSQPGGAVARFANPVFVDAGEWVALVVNRMGTAATSGVIAYGIQYDFSLEAV